MPNKRKNKKKSKRLKKIDFNKNSIYLFLNEETHAEAWINGGEIPIGLASTHRNAERFGTKTPDENLVHDSPVDLNSIPGVLIRNSRNITINGMIADGVKIPDIIKASFYEEDGIVLCFCKSHGSDLAEKFSTEVKKKACVKINDIRYLKRIIDDQLKIYGKLGACEYTHDHQRNHFLKSVHDSWQKEVRIFWKSSVAKKVLLPPGIATLVEYYK